jgi:hypothetical protein
MARSTLPTERRASILVMPGQAFAASFSRNPLHLI